jgi:hypothetical protein
MAHVWSAMSPKDRTAWRAAAGAAGLKISGYNLWLHCATTNDTDILTTINRQTGSNLALQATEI